MNREEKIELARILDTIRGAESFEVDEFWTPCDYCGRTIDLYDEVGSWRGSISCDECGKVFCGSYKCNFSKHPNTLKEWVDFTCAECVENWRKKND
jgi:hypothetical protein